METRYFLGRDITHSAIIGRKGSATNREKENSPVSTIIPLSRKEADKMIAEFDKRPQSAGLELFELRKVVFR